MKFPTKLICTFISAFFSLFICNANSFANRTPFFDSLTPNLQYVMRKYGEYQKNFCHDDDPPEVMAEEGQLRYKDVLIDGEYCEPDSEENPKLTNEDIESLSNLTNMEMLTLRCLDLTEVDLTKLLDLNPEGNMRFVCLDYCTIKESDSEFKSLLSREGYTVGTEAGKWIAWPGVDPDSIFNGR